MDYLVTFFSVDKEEKVSANGKREIEKSYKVLGSIVLDDNGVDDKNVTLVGKAYNYAPQFLRADRVIVEKL